MAIVDRGQLKVLYLQPAEAFGGAERQGVMHIRRLRERGVDVVAVVGPGQPIVRELERAQVDEYVFCDCFPRSTHSRMSWWGNLTYGIGYLRSWWQSVRAVHRVASEHNVEALIANRSFSWPVAALVARRLGLPYFVRAGSRSTTRWAGRGLRSMRWAWGRPRALLSNCKAVEVDLAPHFDCPTYLVPNGIDTERFTPAAPPSYRDALSHEQRKMVVGLAARPAPEKGLEFLADVIGALATRFPHVSVLVAGEFGWRRHYEELFASRGLGSNVVFLGHVDRMESFYTSCDVVVLTSRQRSIEGLPNALMEAMACERPIVATDVGGVAELVEHNVQGLLVSHDDVQGFVDALARLLNDRELQRALGQAGRQRIVEHFSEQRVADQLVAILGDTLRGIRMPVPAQTAVSTRPG